MSGPATTLYLVRHGESEANAAQVMAGKSDSPLTARGRRQAEAVATALAHVKLDKVVSSALSRTRDTGAVIAARLGIPLEVEPDLGEIDVGTATNKPWHELDSLPGHKPGGYSEWESGETLAQVRDRMREAMARIVGRSPGQKVCVVGHGGTTRVFVSDLLGLLPELTTAHSTNTAVTVVRADDDGYRIERLFDDAHVV